MRLMWIVGLVLSGCSGGLTGEWQGVLECGTVNWDFAFTLDKDAGKTWIGDGKQEREYTNVDGETTYSVTEFDIDGTLSRSGGAQSVDTNLTCTFAQTVVSGVGGAGDPTILDEGCPPLKYRDYQMAWDGQDQLTVAGADACEGTLTRL